MLISEFLEHIKLLVEEDDLPNVSVQVSSEGPWGTEGMNPEGLYRDGSTLFVSIGDTFREYYDTGYHQGREDAYVPGEGEDAPGG